MLKRRNECNDLIFSEEKKIGKKFLLFLYQVRDSPKIYTSLI